MLRGKIARSRELVVRDLSGLGYELNFPLKLRRTFQRHTVLWVGGALAFGLVVSLLRARTKKVYVTTSGKKPARPQVMLCLSLACSSVHSNSDSICSDRLRLPI